MAMPGSIFVTFREQTTGRINDLLIDEHEACAHSQNLLGYLAGALLNFKDEGVEFTPAVILCDNLGLFFTVLSRSGDIRDWQSAFRSGIRPQDSQRLRASNGF